IRAGFEPGRSARSQSCPMLTSTELQRSVKIATVIGSWNEFFTDAISYPACVSLAVGVVATGDGSAGDTPVDTVAHFFNSASLLNLLAPGDFITSSGDGDVFDHLRREQTPYDLWQAGMISGVSR